LKAVDRLKKGMKKRKLDGGRMGFGERGSVWGS
jgi:hypothetical protein